MLLEKPLDNGTSGKLLQVLYKGYSLPFGYSNWCPEFLHHSHSLLDKRTTLRDAAVHTSSQSLHGHIRMSAWLQLD